MPFGEGGIAEDKEPGLRHTEDFLELFHLERADWMCSETKSSQHSDVKPVLRGKRLKALSEAEGRCVFTNFVYFFHIESSRLLFSTSSKFFVTFLLSRMQHFSNSNKQAQ
ncbi:hypothetical protein DV515_00003552 [Chloebia gouldiae]|uniref:Uncharacterized protein n=1 Tax=Chloebia gouldiae TaxID=44316 RepID=A0A3L8STL8_CHLGU|nr:hypothetical protein DV515_00003552 [Chloebia gouldiae]